MGDANMDERLLRRPLVENVENCDLGGRVWEESKEVWRIAIPGMLTRVTSFGILVRASPIVTIGDALITQSFMGHISALDLAAYSLVQILTWRFANGIQMGMSSATETLCGQAYGAGQHHVMGIYLQRSWIVNFVTVTILLPIFLFATPIFNLLGEDPAIAEKSSIISLWFIPRLYSLIFYFTIQMYLQAQLKNMIVGWLSTLSFVIHIVLSWLFVNVLDFGVPGAMGAMTISSWFVAFGQFVYTVGGWCPHTWKGFTKAAFTDLWPITKLSISSGLMLCLEYWYNSVLILIAGYTSNAQVTISAFSICLNISAWVFMFFMGFLAAACVRVANELGRGNARAAKFSIKIIMTTAVVLGLIFCVLFLIFDRHIAYLFTSSKEVADTVSDLSILLASTILLNSIQPVLSGVAIGAGMQSRVALINLVCYYVIGVPLGVVLALVAQLQVKGLWVGMICGMSVQALALGYMTWRTDWDEQVKKASERLDQWLVKPSEEPGDTGTYLPEDKTNETVLRHEERNRAPPKYLNDYVPK